MKNSKTIYVALAAGIAVVGLVGFLLTTENGKKVSEKLKRKGSGFINDISSSIDGFKQEFETWKGQDGDGKAKAHNKKEMVV